MTKTEQAAVVRLVRYMQSLQRQITPATVDEATDKEVLTLFQLLWQWTPTANQPVPSKHTIEKLIGLMRGCEPTGYCYISAQDVARIIRETSRDHLHNPGLSIYVSKGSEQMTDREFYDKGRWNYKKTPLVDLLWEMQANPKLYNEDGERRC